MTGQVFISYNHADQEYVEKLAGALVAEGLPVWYDYQVATGDRFEKIIKRQIEACTAFVVVMTPTSDDSDWVSVEVNYAKQLGKPILPLLLAGDVFMRLNNLDYADVRGGALPPQRFLDRLKHLVGAADPAPQPAAPPPPVVVRTPVVAAAEPGELLRTISAGESNILAFSPDGRLLATCGPAGGLAFWEAATGHRRPVGVSGIIQALAWSPDSRQVLTADAFGAAGTWDAATGEPRLSLSLPVAAGAVAWSRDGRQLATASGVARTWDAASGAPRLTFGSTGVGAVTFSPDGRHLACQANVWPVPVSRTPPPPAIEVWNTGNGTPTAALTLAEPPRWLCFLPDGRLVAAFERTLRLIDTTSWKAFRDLEVGNAPPGRRAWAAGISQPSPAGPMLAVSPDGRWFAVAEPDNRVTVYSLDNGTARFTFGGHGGDVTAAAFSPDGTLLVTGCIDGVVRVWQL